MSKSVPSAVVAALVLGSQPLWADVTPEEVWQNWQDSAAAQGQKVTAASEAMEGDTLTVSGITLEVTGEGAGSAMIGEMKFRDKGDGTVAIIMPESFPILMTLPPTPGEAGAVPQELTLTVRMPGADITASGVPLSISYATNAPTLELSADIIEEGGVAAKLVASLTGVTGNYLIEAAEVGTNLTQDFVAKTFDLTVETVGAPEGEVSVKLSLADIGGSAVMTGVPPEGMADTPVALAAGMTMDFAANYGVGSFDISGTDAGQPLKMTGALGGGDFTMGASSDRFSYDASGKSISLNFSGTDTMAGTPITFSATLANTSSSLEMLGANWSSTEDFDAALKAGLKMSAAFGLGPSSFDFVGGADGGQTKLNAQLGGLDTGFAMEAAAMQYDLGAKALAMTVSSPEIPMPEASLDVTEIAMDFAMPLSKSDTPAPFNLLTKVVDLNVAEALWSMVDPAGMLPHDPATLIFDTKGTTTLTRDLVDPTIMMEAAPPGLLNSFDISEVLLRFAGAEVTAAGAFTFDNSDMMTIPGMPLPTGKIDIKAVGLNGLIDKLVAMGLLPEDEAMTGRMMMSMFANSSPDKDEVTSTLEFKDGGFFANGQQLQ